MKQANIYTHSIIIVLLTMFLLRSSMAIVFSGRDCSGNWINFGTAVLDGDTYSYEEGGLRAGYCRFYYYGSNCEDGRLVAIIRPNTPCANFWSTVRSAQTDAC